MDLGELISGAEESCAEEWQAYALAVKLPNGEVLYVKSASFDPDAAGRIELHCDWGPRAIRKVGA